MPNTEYDYHYVEKNAHIKFVICEKGGINILNSHEIKDDEVKLRFLNYITDYSRHGINFGKRTIYSMFIEWKAHSILYNKGIFKKRTGDTGLDPKESWIRRLFYRTVCFLFNEK